MAKYQLFNFKCTRDAFPPIASLPFYMHLFSKLDYYFSDNTLNAGPDDFVLDVVYHDFDKSHTDFYKVTRKYLMSTRSLMVLSKFAM